MLKLEEIFHIRYGHSLELNRLSETSSEKGVPFVSRKSGDNGIAAHVDRVKSVHPAPAGELTCALSGNGVLSTFIQEREFYTGFHVARLKPKFNFSKSELLYYCLCISKNRYKYSYGRQANRTLKDLLVPAIDELPNWINDFDLSAFSGANKPKIKATVSAPPYSDTAKISDLFDIKNGITASGLKEEKKRFVNAIMYVRPASTHIRSLRSFIPKDSVDSSNIYPAGSLYVSTNGEGSHSYSYVSTEEFVPNSDVSVLIPKEEIPIELKIYYSKCISANRPLFSYGRKPKGKRLGNIMIPVFHKESYREVVSFVNSLKYSCNID